MSKKINLFAKRARRVRKAVKLQAKGKPRLSVFRSNSNIYAQIIDDNKMVTLVAASTRDKDLQDKNLGCTKEAAIVVGELLAKRALANKVEEVVFDRGGYRYHGRIKALADAARENGLKF